MSSREVQLKGCSICEGISIGSPFFFISSEEVVPEFSIASTEVEDEIKRYRRALKSSTRDVLRLKQQLEEENISEGVAILDTHLQILYDPLITTQIEKRIYKTKKNSEYVFHAVINEYQERFNKIDDGFFKDRFKDLQDIRNRVMRYLRKSVRVSLVDIPGDSIVFAKDLTPLDTIDAKSSIVKAFVTEYGGETSHTAILARAKGIPYVSNVDFSGFNALKNAVVIVDGYSGKIILNPSKATLTHYQSLKEHHERQRRKIAQESRFEVETIDGYKVILSANIEMLDELEILQQYQGCGIGLLRSEYIFLSQGEFPDEEQQYEVYRSIVERLQGRPVTIRTFDIGGDKFEELIDNRYNDNSVLGCRGIRFLFQREDVFKTQVRAILRASAYGDIKMMFPMISGLDEWRRAVAFVEEAKEELFFEGVPYDRNIQLGCMVEVPSTAIMGDLFAKECDFLSIGTNDLVQYALAVDRNNLSMNHIYKPMHPAVIRLIKTVVLSGQYHNTPVSVCGETAANPLFTPFLLGIGVNELSVASRYIPEVRKRIREISIVEANNLAQAVMEVSTADEVYNMLTSDISTITAK